MPGHVRTIWILDWIMTVFWFIGIFGVIVPLLIVPPYPIGAGRIAGGSAGAGVTGAFFLLSIVALIAVKSGKPWGRIYHLIYSGLNLLAIPIGTIVQGFAFYYLLADPEVRAWFEEKRPPSERPRRVA